ncbi:hypothetical protein OG455_37590 [Kitasatospora sp. NBC_01287]|uniref:hypothetical protein n=1 Tax=Kitasatospora sp. NBC_01287 TaxID=2903573 RepID=UPI002253E372|nr:hypothetical protein [Kitasatospora sp. NBC_01287]MCX4751155.1 hypothetical protein [Kitasatospora sp. NBC_01287]
MPSHADVLAAFTRGRLAVEDHVRESALQDREWGEEETTVQLLMKAHPEVRYVEFARTHEGQVGADWLWWFVDLTGECFGLLVQAKKLKPIKTGFTVDFKHPDNTSKQMADLLRTADRFNVPAVYALYCGDLTYRGGARHCPACASRQEGVPQVDPSCLRCERASILLLPALAAQQLAVCAPRQAGLKAFSIGLPLEDAIDRNVFTPEIKDSNLYQLRGELRKFLEDRQYGPREIAKAIFDIVSKMGSGVFDQVMERELPMILNRDAVFRTVPADRAYFSAPYYADVLCGLRRRLPKYVEPVMNGAGPPVGAERLAGMVLVHL